MLIYTFAGLDPAANHAINASFILNIPALVEDASGLVPDTK